MNTQKIYIPLSGPLTNTTIELPTSKSISNRVLIINQLAGGRSAIHNLSEARDTKTMQHLLSKDSLEKDVLDAGTTMRFLTAYYALTDQQKIMTGTDRMQQRPIKLLVDALRVLGVSIQYLKKEGFPPIKISGFKQQLSDSISIPGDVSSQYISALLMLAPILPEGLRLTLTGKVGSRPYIEMTLRIMNSFGVNSEWKGDTIEIKPQTYKPTEFFIEPDWSGASYWYSFLALSKNSTLRINKLKDISLQGDRKMATMMESLGVSTSFDEQGALLSKIAHENSVSFDFTDCPDLAQTIAVICAAKGIRCEMTGLESLKIKETDRVLALQNELSKIGATLNESDNHWTLIPGDKLPQKVEIDTYEDHRMAMAFAPLCMLMDVSIHDPAVVNKSFPTFWKVMENAGIAFD